MFARVAAFEGGDTGRLSELMRQRQAAEGSLGMPDGVTRVLVLSDDEHGRRLFITFFESRAALESAEPQFDAMGKDVPEEVGGRRTSLDVYEVDYDGQG